MIQVRKHELCRFLISIFFCNFGVPLVLYLSHSILPFSITMQIDKNTKYDRQIRLWATTGQSRLEKSHVCVIGATATGSEILKNLVLPGIGTFTIIDSAIVAEDDLSGNFFLQDDDLGSEIAPAMCKSLLDHAVSVHQHNGVAEDFEEVRQADIVEHFHKVSRSHFSGSYIHHRVFLGTVHLLSYATPPSYSCSTT